MIRDELSEIDGWVVTNSKMGPSRKMSKITPWEETDIQVTTKSKMSSDLIKQKFVEDFSQSFKTKRKLNAPQVDLIDDPFQVSTVDNFVADDSAIQSMIEEMETLVWTRKQMDLYEFYQTTDLANIKSSCLAQFYKLLNTDVRCWMEQLTGMKFKKISASCSMYNCGDFLLTHDDLLSDRLIAFVFYLSPWENTKTWSESMGGALELFHADEDGQPKFPVEKRIYPANNRFVFFKVEKKSYHQVGEVLTKDYPRLTINGWFHGFKDNEDFDFDAAKVKIPNVLAFKRPFETIEKLKSFITKTYLMASIKASIQKQIEENSETALGEFLIPEIHENITKELQEKKFVWKTVGPSNQQNYDRLCLKDLPEDCKTRSLVELMTSKEMFKLLHEYTELDLHGGKAKKPKCSVEIQRWKGGSYTLLGGPSTYNNDTLDLILYFGNNDNIGVITYLTPEEDSAQSVATSDDDSVLLTIHPQNNFLNIVYRSQGTTKFTKYCSKSSAMNSEFNYILFCSYKE